MRLDKLVPLDPWTIHDLRRTVATGMQKLGVGLKWWGNTWAGVGFSSWGCRYLSAAHLRREKRAALNAWAAHISALLEGRKPGKVLFYAHTRIK